jgi:proteasome accessory factor A
MKSPRSRARVVCGGTDLPSKIFTSLATRAKLRGDFIRAAQAHGRDFTVDWVHLKLNDQAQRTVLCKDPFRAVDDRVDRLMETIERSPSIQRPL